MIVARSRWIGLAMGSFCGLVLAQDGGPQTMKDLRPESPVAATAAEARGLLLSSTVKTKSAKGTNKTYQNASDGTLYALKSQLGLRKDHRTSGEWSVRDDGAYCVSVPWRGDPEKWCRYLVRANGNLYLARGLEDDAAVWPIEIEK